MKKLFVIFFSLVLSGCTLISLFYPMHRCSSLSGWCTSNRWQTEVNSWETKEKIIYSQQINGSPDYKQSLILDDFYDKRLNQFENICNIKNWRDVTFEQLTESQKMCLKNAGYCRLYNATNSIYDCNKEEILRNAKKKNHKE